MTDKALPFVIVGHVDHGKSTLIGRLLLDTGSIPAGTAHPPAADGNGGAPLAHVTDQFSEERVRGITIEYSQRVFESSIRRYVIIDTPGHREFLKNMFSGASLAEAAVLLIDVGEGIMEQTCRHAGIISLVGIRQVIVAVNKMDIAGWGRERFEAVAEKAREMLAALKIARIMCIPLCALTGDNVAVPSRNMPWYSGPTLLDAMDGFSSAGRTGTELRFSVQDRYLFSRHGSYVVGRVESGVLQTGMPVVCRPGGMKAKIVSVEKYGAPPLAMAGPGECVAIRVEGEACPSRGDTLTDARDGARTSTIVRGRVFWLSPEPGCAGDRLLFRCATQDIHCVLETIADVFDPGDGVAAPMKGGAIAESHVADVFLRLARPAVFDSFGEIPSMGRFVLEKGGEAVAAGIIV